MVEKHESSVEQSLTASGAGMTRRVTVIARLMLCVLLASYAHVVYGQDGMPVNVLAWRAYDTQSGANTHESILSPVNVNVTEFGKLFSRPVDGYVYAQPLYVSGLRMADGIVHNVLFVATEHDTVYAFDADTNGGADAFPLWQASMISPEHGAASGATPVPNSDLGTGDIVPEVGITSTPVIDLSAHCIYIVAKTKENGSYIQRVHALDLTTGAEHANSPSAPIEASVLGNGTGASGGRLQMSPLWQMNRAALALWNGHLYVAFGSHGDNGPWHGWVIAFNANTLEETGVVCLSPNGYGNGIWSAGAAPPVDTVDPNGRMFVVTGNGSFTASAANAVNSDFGDSIVRLDMTGGAVTPSDAFTPFNQSSLAASDADQGSGGILIPPDQQGAHPHILIQVGKEGRILVLDRDHLGGYVTGGSYNTAALQDISGQIHGLWSTPAYWNGRVYLWARGDHLKAFDLNSGLLSLKPTDSSDVIANFPGATPVISSNGIQNGIIWAIRSDAYATSGSEILYAFNANGLSAPLYESDTNAGRDDAGQANKFVVPVVANGRVYVGAAHQVSVYGLLNGQQQAVAPVIAPNGGTFQSSQQITLSTVTPNANIYYTTDGSAPSPTAMLYSGPFALTTRAVVRAVASASGFLQSPISAATFNVVTQTPPPQLVPAPGTYISPQQITLSDTAQGSVLFYTLDGSTPTTASNRYTGPITISSTTTLSVIAISSTLSPSNVVSAMYAIQSGGASIDFGSGFADVNGLTLNGSAVHNDDSRLQLTTGQVHQAGTVFFNTPIDVRSFVTDFSFQLSLPGADGFTFTIQNVGPTALGPSGGGLGYGPDTPGATGGIAKSVALKFDLYNNHGEGSNSIGLYTGGASPTVPATDLTGSGIDLHSGDSISAHVTYDGASMEVSLFDAVTGSTYNQKFSIDVPKAVGNNTAYVGFTGGTGGAVASQKILNWTFYPQTGTITPLPFISPNGGGYSSSQIVTLTDSDPSAKIFYTTDGTVPNSSSAVYSVPIVLQSGTTTISASAISAGASQSPIASATFIIAPPITAAPIFTPAAASYAGPQTVTISSATPGATIHYSTDGSTPTIDSSVYVGPIDVRTTETIKAIAAAPGCALSALSTGTFTIQSSAFEINFGDGFPTGTGLALNGSAKADPSAEAIQLTDMGKSEAGSFWVKTPITISRFTTDFSFQIQNAGADGFTFTIQNVGPTALGPSGGGLGYGPDTPGATGGIAKSVALKFDLYNNHGEGSNSIGLYTGGASPTVPSTNLIGTGLLLSSGDVFHVHLVYDGAFLQFTITDTITSASYSTTFPVDIPGALGASIGYMGFTGGTGGQTAITRILNWTATSALPQQAALPIFSPAPGAYPGNLDVTLTEVTPNATVYYTTDGSQPSHSSSKYTAPIRVAGTSLTIKAFASAGGMQDSAVVTGTFQMLPPVSPPSFAPASGIYGSAQTVAISSATTNARIYYTTDGSTPTPGAALYNGPVVVNQSQVLQAIVVVPNVAQSAPASATYTIESGVPTINFPAGFVNTLGLTLNGHAKSLNDATLGLTDGTTGQASSVFFSTPVDIRHFNTTFQFQLLNAQADGFTFTIQSNSPTALGPLGGGLGYGPDAPGGTGGIPHSVAVKFDIHNNRGEGPDSTGVYALGASPTMPSMDMTASGVNLASGDRLIANLAYDGTTLTMVVSDPTTGKSFHQAFAIDIPSAVSNASAYVGFTAGTGGLSAIQKVVSWTYAPGSGNTGNAGNVSPR